MRNLKKILMIFTVSIIMTGLVGCSSNDVVNENKTAPKLTVEPAAPTHILGATKDQVKKILKSYKIISAYQENVDPNAIKFENNSLIIVVAFDTAGLAEGVGYLSFDGDFLTGQGSYVDLNYDTLVNQATGGASLPIETNPGTKYPTEIYIGNTHR